MNQQAQVKALYDRQKQIFAESLEIAGSSSNRDTILSRLDVAANMLAKLQDLVQQYPFLDESEVVEMNLQLIEVSRRIFNTEEDE